jgi:hypothetical protein
VWGPTQASPHLRSIPPSPRCATRTAVTGTPMDPAVPYYFGGMNRVTVSGACFVVLKVTVDYLVPASFACLS